MRFRIWEIDLFHESRQRLGAFRRELRIIDGAKIAFRDVLDTLRRPLEAHVFRFNSRNLSGYLLPDQMPVLDEHVPEPQKPRITRTKNIWSGVLRGASVRLNTRSWWKECKLGPE